MEGLRGQHPLIAYISSLSPPSSKKVGIWRPRVYVGTAEQFVRPDPLLTADPITWLTRQRFLRWGHGLL